MRLSLLKFIVAALYLQVVIANSEFTSFTDLDSEIRPRIWIVESGRSRSI